jgi:phosphatidate cytidylyltransferase
VLRWRLISAAVILTVLLTLIWLDYRQVLFGTPGAWLLALLLFVSVLGTEEVLSLLAAQGHRPIRWIVYAGNVTIPLAASLTVVLAMIAWTSPGLNSQIAYLAPLVALAVFCALIFIGEMTRFRQPGTAIVNVALSVFTLVYVGVLISFWALLRLQGSNDWGMAALFSMLLIVKMADTGAFAFGKTLGRHKMTPLLSPGKTWEGTLGGLATAVVTSWAFFHFFAPRIVSTGYVEPTLPAAAAYGMLVALAGMVGDLAESLLKRDMQRKDSSTWLRGLGGVLDIIDAPLVAGPVAWLCWTLGLVGP